MTIKARQIRTMPQNSSKNPGKTSNPQSRSKLRNLRLSLNNRTSRSQDDQQPYAMDQRQENTQSRQEVENWLRRIPDDPGGLLRRKFEQQQQQRQPAPRGEQTW